MTPPIGISGTDKVEAHKAVTFQAMNLEEAVTPCSIRRGVEG